MYLIYRSILKEMLISFGICLVFLNCTLMMEKLLRLSRLFATVGATIEDVFKMIIYIQPQMLILTLPMALLLSTLLVFGRMNADNEITILKSSGISFFSISRPVAYLGGLCFLLSIFMGFYLGPKGAVALREKITEIISTRAPLTIEEGIFNTAFKGIVILIREKPDNMSMRGIFIIDDRNPQEQKILFAKEGIISPIGDSLGFSLKDGNIYIFGRDVTTQISFKTYFFSLTPQIESQRRTINEMTPRQLLNEAEVNPDRRLNYILEYHRRFSMPAMCIIIVLIGPTLALMAGKSGKLGGLTIGFLVFGIYYTLLIYGENLALSKKIPPIIGAWGAFTILVLSSIVIAIRVNKR